jgi:hypothetical protein
MRQQQEITKQFLYLREKLIRTEIQGIQSGVKLEYPGGTFQERTQAMIRLKNELQNRK